MHPEGPGLDLCESDGSSGAEAKDADDLVDLPEWLRPSLRVVVNPRQPTNQPQSLRDLPGQACNGERHSYSVGDTDLADKVWRVGKRLFERGDPQSEIEAWGKRTNEWTYAGRMLDCLKEEYARDIRTERLVGSTLKLNGLDLEKNQLPATLDLLVSVDDLKLNRCNLSILPRIPASLALEVISLQHNRLSAIPEWIGQFPLISVYLNNNQFTDFPKELYRCGLAHLDLRDNPLRSLPSDINLLDNIHVLYLSGTQIKVIPDSLASCTRLEALDISGTRLREFPRVIETLPKLKQLTIDEDQFFLWRQPILEAVDRLSLANRLLEILVARPSEEFLTFLEDWKRSTRIAPVIGLASP